MGTEKKKEKASNSNCGGDGDGSAVVLNVYDLTPINNYMYWFGLGIFHSGIQVHGKEYGFGAHDFPASGVFEVEPRNCPGFIYRTSITLGHTNMNSSDFRTFIENMACALCSCLLPESLQVTSVKQLPEYHECSDDEFVESLSTATPRESTEIDDEPEKHLLSPSSRTEDVTFIKETPVK
ncbi:hypothetical protein AAHE18_01G244400 [Arachis hypogaea]